MLHSLAYYRMNKSFQKISLIILLIFAAGFLLDPYLCEEESSHQSSNDSTHCSLQSCPAHNLVPPTQVNLKLIKTDKSDSSFIQENFFYSISLPTSIFRPPISLA